MILQALVSLYEDLAAAGTLERPGWSKIRVSYALELDPDGALLAVLPLKTPQRKGKKEVLTPQAKELPAAVKRSSGFCSNFLWDNSAYLLGVDAKGDPVRAQRCFETAKALHLKLLNGTDSEAATAVRRFFETWQPEQAESHPALREDWDDLLSGGNLTFLVNEHFVAEDPQIRLAWQASYEDESGDRMGRCLVTGAQGPIARLHPAFHGVKDAQSSGASLVSFNAPAYDSYGHDDEQGYNAPVGKYAAFAYGAALNWLLSDREHTRLIGDATTVFWAEGGDAAYPTAMQMMLSGPSDTVSETRLSGLVTALSRGEKVNWDGVPLNPRNRFYILGLAPNAARLSVRFFLQSEFGDFARNLQAHYDRLRIVKPSWEKYGVLPLWKLLDEVTNHNAQHPQAPPELAGDLTRAVLTGGRYPATLFEAVLLRIRAESGRDKISYGRAAILKAYLIRNFGKEVDETMEANPSVPYALGCVFSELEAVQQAASPGLNATIRDRYFNSACTTPALVFPILLKLKNNHMRVVMREKPGLGVTMEKRIGALIDRLGTAFPAHLSLEEQGMFILGYYQQTQKRYEKSETKEEAAHV